MRLSETSRPEACRRRSRNATAGPSALALVLLLVAGAHLPLSSAWQLWPLGGASTRTPPTQPLVTARLHLEGATRGSFVAASQDLVLESAVARMLYPAAARITRAADVPEGGADGDRFVSLALDVELTPLQQGLDATAFAEAAWRALNSREFADHLESSGIHPSRAWQVPVEVKRPVSSAGFIGQAAAAMRALSPRAAAAKAAVAAQQQQQQRTPHSVQLPLDMLGSVVLDAPAPTADSSAGAAGRLADAAAAVAAGVEHLPPVRGEAAALLPHLPVAAALRHGIVQPASLLAAEVARSLWQSIQQAEDAAAAALRRGSSLDSVSSTPPLQVQEVEVWVGGAEGGAPQQLQLQLQQPSYAGEGGADMEVSVLVESEQRRPAFPLLQRWIGRRHCGGEGSGGEQAVAIATAVVEALAGPDSNAEGLQQQAEAHKRVQAVLQHIEASGALEGQSEPQRLTAKAAAAVAAAASAMDKPWREMEMEVEVTQTTHGRSHWQQAALLAAAVFALQAALCVLAAPWLVRFVAQQRACGEDSEFEDGEEDDGRRCEAHACACRGCCACGGEVADVEAKQRQMLVASLVEAGVYKQLLANAH